MWTVQFGFFIACCVCFVVTRQQNTTNPRRGGQHRDSNLMSAIQQMQLQLTSLETESQRHSSRIQEVVRATTRLETQRQELIGTLDRSESRLSQRMDDLKGDVRKIITLQDVMREDMEKIQQNQLMAKIWLEDQIRQMMSNNIISKSESTADPSSTLYANADILANLQILQSTIYSLRRMADTLQSSINVLKVNLTDLTNITRTMLQYEQESLVTRTYFQSSLQMFMDDKAEQLPLIQLINPNSNEESDGRLPRDCKEVQEHVQNTTGIYRIQMEYSPRPIFVYCDMETEGGGWTVFQRRRDGSIDFLREWQDYKHGFGNVGGEFWLGNENLYLLTHQDIYELRIDLADFDEGSAYSKYGAFAVGSEKEKYMLKLLGPLIGGDAGDGMTYHASMPFSTIDVDHDRWEGGHCAKDHTGGWWYNQCDASNLNGKYLQGMNPHEYQGIYWHEWHGPSYSLLSTKMMLRPLGHPFVNVPKPTAPEPSSTEDETDFTPTEDVPAPSETVETNPEVEVYYPDAEFDDIEQP